MEGSRANSWGSPMVEALTHGQNSREAIGTEVPALQLQGEGPLREPTFMKGRMGEKAFLS